MENNNGLHPSISSSIIGGSGNTINKTTRGAIIGGISNEFPFSIVSPPEDSVIIGGDSNIMSHNRSVILGGQNITSTSNDTVYVPNLNIGTIGTGTSVNNLGVDISGNVVVGSSGGGTSYWSAGTGTNAIVMNNGGNTSSGTLSTAQGFDTTASGDYAHAEGDRTDATGISSHAEGLFSNASGDYAHAEGNNTDATGISSHAEGQLSLASGNYSHAEGLQTDSTNNGSHSEGTYSLASGVASHAQNRYTIASGNYSHASGYGYDSNDRVVASGETSFTHQYVSNSSGYLGVYGNNSSILGGIDNNIDSSSQSSFIGGGENNRIVGANRSVVLGGDGITATTNNTVYVPYLNIGLLGAGDSITNLGIDSSGNVVSGDTGGSTGPDSITFEIFNTSPASPDPYTIYDDGNIRLLFDDAATDDIEIVVLTNPSTGPVHVVWSEPTAGTSGSANVTTASGQIPLNTEVSADDVVDFVIWAPEDSTYPYYEAKVTVSNGTFTSIPAVARVSKWNSPS